MAGLNLPSRVGGAIYSQTPVASLPVVGGAVGGGIGTALGGGGLREVGQSVVGGGIASLLASALPGLPGLPGLGGSLAADALSENPNPAAAGISSVANTAGSLAGAALLAPLAPIGAIVGGTLAGYYASRSLEDGYLGDLADSRSSESSRDRMEDRGFSVGETKDMAAEDKAAGSNAGRQSHPSGYSVSPGLTENDPFGQAAARAKAEMFGTSAKSLSEYGSSKYGGGNGGNSGGGRSDAGMGGDADSGDGGGIGDGGSTDGNDGHGE